MNIDEIEFIIDSRKAILKLNYNKVEHVLGYNNAIRNYIFAVEISTIYDEVKLV